MTERQQEILTFIIEEYTETGVPVGSAFLAEKKGLDVSGATLRNEMRDLEEMGFLTHPHTSAGRIPTEQGYRFYIEHALVPTEPKLKEKELLAKAFSLGENKKEKAKLLARQTAEMVHSAVILAFEKNSLYYTGISELFSQPEFRDSAHTVSLSTLFDECEERVERLYERVPKGDIQVLVGSDNPLGSLCGLVVCRVSPTDLFTVLGPMRMDYARAVGVVHYIQEMK